MTHILLIEDDDILREVTSRALHKRGFNVTELSHYLTAEKYITAAIKNNSAKIDAAILDLKLHNQLSLPLISLLRHNIPAIKILVLTGYASIATAVEAVKLGADNYLPKPASLDDMLMALTLLNSSKSSESSLNNIESSNTTIVSTQRLEWEHIQRMLLKNKGNISAAARELNMHRRTLQRKLQKYPHKK